MNIGKVFHLIFTEYKRACDIHPVWPTDIVRAAAKVSEEAGELIKAVNDLDEGHGKWADIVDEAVHTGAMAVRFLINFKGYE